MIAEDVESRIKAKVFPRRTRLKEIFRDYDKGRCGYITIPQFARALDLCQLELSSADIGLLAQKYQGTDQWGRVNYTEFAKCIDEVFVIEGLETMPSLTVSTGFGLNRSLSLGNTTVALSDADQYLRRVVHWPVDLGRFKVPLIDRDLERPQNCIFTT